MDGMPDVHAALQDFDWFRGPSPLAVPHLVRRGRVLGLCRASCKTREGWATSSGGITARNTGRALCLRCQALVKSTSVERW